MKYRRLTQEELNDLETEFVRFLASNQVTASDWERLKAENRDKVEGLIEIFSDLIYEDILGKVEYMVRRHPRDLRAFKFVEDKILLIGLVNNGNDFGPPEVDFTKSKTPDELMIAMRRSNDEIRLYAAERKYRKDRKLEALELMEDDATISKDGAMYKLLHTLRASQLN
ncbi:MAG: DUF6495 family protein [Bacteroidota bacterium]